MIHPLRKTARKGNSIVIIPHNVLFSKMNILCIHMLLYHKLRHGLKYRYHPAMVLVGPALVKRSQFTIVWEFFIRNDECAVNHFLRFPVIGTRWQHV